MRKSRFTDSQIMAVLKQLKPGSRSRTSAASTASAVRRSISGALGLAAWTPPASHGEAFQMCPQLWGRTLLARH